jgi:hypothetical protein
MTRLLPFALVVALVATLTAGAATRASGNRRHAFRPGLVLRGHVAALLPGQRARMTIQVKNRLRRAVHLRSIRTTVRAPGRGCAAGNLVVRPYRGKVRIGARRSRSVVVAVSMRRDSPSACQGTVFRLTFQARASA